MATMVRREGQSGRTAASPPVSTLSWLKIHLFQVQDFPGLPHLGCQGPSVPILNLGNLDEGPGSWVALLGAVLSAL